MRGNPEEAARAFLIAYGPTLSLADAARLRFLRTVDAGETAYVHFVDVLDGRPVLGSSVIVGIRRGHVLSASLVDAHHDASERPTTAEGRSWDLAREAVPGRLLSRRRGGLVRDGQVLPVEIFDVAGARRHERTRVVVDLLGGRVLGAVPRLLETQGRVYENDPVTDGATTTVELPDLAAPGDRLSGRSFHVRSCDPDEDGCRGTAFALPDAAGDFLEEPREPAFDDGFAEVNAYHHAARAAAYFRETHGFIWTCAGRERMDVTVNYSEAPGVPYDNAGYVPTLGPECGAMLFGQGALDFAYDGDVVAHEFAHAVVEQTAALMSFRIEPLGVSYAPGAINEGVADYVAATVSDDPRMAVYFASGAGEGALRRLDNGLRCPDDLVGQVHFDGRIFAGLLWDLRTRLGAAKADGLMYATLATLEPTPTLAGAAEVVSMVAASFERAGRLTTDERVEVDRAIEARGLLACERIVPLDDRRPHLAHTGLGTFTATAGARIAPVQFRVDVPADAQALRIRLRRVSGLGRFRLHARRGRPPEVAGIRVVADRSLELDAMNGVTLEGDELPRCDTLYLAVETVDLEAIGAALFEVDAQLSPGGEPTSCAGGAGGPPDAGGRRGDAGGPLDGWTPGGGCHCGVARPRNAPPLWWPVAPLFVWLRHRSRTARRRAAAADG